MLSHGVDFPSPDADARPHSFLPMPMPENSTGPGAETRRESSNSGARRRMSPQRQGQCGNIAVAALRLAFVCRVKIAPAKRQRRSIRSPNANGTVSGTEIALARSTSEYQSDRRMKWRRGWGRMARSGALKGCSFQDHCPQKLPFRSGPPSAAVDAQLPTSLADLYASRNSAHSFISTRRRSKKSVRR